jgi:predicted phage tail protein
LSDGGAPITDYVATATPGGATCTTSGATSCTVTGLTNGTAYSFSVRAVNVAGTGPESNVVTVTPRTVPGAVQNLVAATAKGRGVLVTWAAPVSNGGSAITNYRIYRRMAGGTFGLIATVGTVDKYTDTGTVRGTRYYYVVRAVNAVGEGPSSIEVSAVAK